MSNGFSFRRTYEPASPSGRNRIASATSIRMARCYAAQCKPPTSHSTMPPNRLQGVEGATGLIAATPHGAKQRRLHRGEDPAIELDACDKEVNCDPHAEEPFSNRFFAKPARKSVSTWARRQPTIEGRAINTSSMGTANLC